MNNRDKYTDGTYIPVAAEAKKRESEQRYSCPCIICTGKWPRDCFIPMADRPMVLRRVIAGYVDPRKGIDYHHHSRNKK